MTDFSKAQLATILSALDGRPRKPANKTEALKALGRSAERLGLTSDAVLEAAPGLLDGRLDAEAWRAGLTEQPEPVAAGDPRTARRGRAKPKPAQAAEPARRRTRAGSKQALLIALLRRPEGATIAQVAEATGWQQHTIRGAISGALKKKVGLEVTSTKERDGPRVYRLA